MILLLSDVHGRLEVVNAQIAHAELRGAIDIEAVVVLGDVGFFEPIFHDFFRRRGERFLRPVYCIEGNHEDFGALDALVDRYGDVISHWPRGTVHALGPWRILALGGAAYMDAHATPPGAVIGAKDVARCLEHPEDTVDLILSHDCPRELRLPNTPGLEYYGPPGFVEGEALRRHFRPRLWVFGHHHRWFEAEIEGTRFQGLAESWHGYALLSDDGRLEVVHHEVERPPTAWARARARLAAWWSKT